MSGLNYEKRMQMQRLRENRREEICKVLQEDSRIQQVNAWQKNAESQIYRRNIAQAQAEHEREEQVLRARIEAKRAARQGEQESKLATELRKNKDKEMSEMLRMERIISNDPRLRELQSKLKLAYIKKARSNQIKQKTEYELQHKHEQAVLERDMLDKFRQQQEQQEREEIEKRKMLQLAKNDLLNQIEEKKRLNLTISKEEYEQDKRNVDAIVAQIVKEEEESIKLRIKKQEETRREIAEYQRQYEEDKRRMEEEIRQEEEKIRAYRAAVYARDEAKMAKKKEEAARQEKIYQEILRQQEEMQRAAEELTEVREILTMEEMELRAAQKDKERREKVRRMKQEMLEANEAQKQYKAEMEAKMALEEMEIRRRMQAKFDEDARKEEKMLRKKWMQTIEHKKGIEQQRQERLELYQKAKEREMEELARQREEEQFKEKVIQEAARRLLEQHKEVLQEYGTGISGINFNNNNYM